MKYPTLGEIYIASQSQDNLGVADRETVVDYIQRALELANYKANWNSLVGDMDLISDECGWVTLPNEVESVLACNVGGVPAYFRNSWFQYHINGPGSNMANTNGPLGASTAFAWNDQGYFPCFQDVKDWSYVAAICEDPIDGNGSR